MQVPGQSAPDGVARIAVREIAREIAVSGRHPRSSAAPGTVSAIPVVRSGGSLTDWICFVFPGPEIIVKKFHRRLRLSVAKLARDERAGGGCRAWRGADEYPARQTRRPAESVTWDRVSPGSRHGSQRRNTGGRTCFGVMPRPLSCRLALHPARRGSGASRSGPRTATGAGHRDRSAGLLRAAVLVIPQ